MEAATSTVPGNPSRGDETSTSATLNPNPGVGPYESRILQPLSTVNLDTTRDNRGHFHMGTPAIHCEYSETCTAEQSPHGHASVTPELPSHSSLRHPVSMPFFNTNSSHRMRHRTVLAATTRLTEAPRSSTCPTDQPEWHLEHPVRQRRPVPPLNRRGPTPSWSPLGPGMDEQATLTRTSVASQPAWYSLVRVTGILHNGIAGSRIVSHGSETM